MPIYEYRCPQGHVFELFQRMADAPPEGCEICGEGPLEKVLHPVPVFFKGSGFYSTDYGRGKRKKETGEGDGGDGAKTDEGAGATKTEEKKPAAEPSS